MLEAIEEDVPANAIAGSLFARFASRQDDSFAMKVIAALRGEFGGHAIKEAATRAREDRQGTDGRYAGSAEYLCATSKGFRASQSPE